jgi:hypothetical protein
MKVQDVPQLGKLGTTVTWKGRNGMLRRWKGIPKNPRTTSQLVIRANLASQAAAYHQLTDAQQEAWIAAAAQVQTKATLGQSGPLTGCQLFTKLNCALLAIGADPVTAPPAKPLLAVLPVDGFQITNTGGTVAIRLHAPTAPPDGTMLRASAPVNSGVRRASGYRLLGILPSPVTQYIDITSAYTTRFGVPAVGQRVFVSVNANMDGYEGIPQVFSARVPAST